MQIFVLGMHRSGTSMLARLLNMIGLYFAPEGVSTGANQENPKGFWERRDVRQANDRLLHAAGADWDMVGSFSIDKIPAEELEQAQREMRSIILELDAHRPWFIKEPRLCLLFPVWRPLLEMPVCIHIHRHPLEVALSLRERNGFSIPLGLALWERYDLAAFAATVDTPRILVQHAALLRSPVEALQSIAQQLLEFGVRGLREPAEAEINAFIQPGLHHHHARGSSGARDYLLKNHRELAKLIESGAILELAQSELPTLSPYSLDLLKAQDASGGKLAELRDRMRESQAKVSRLEQAIREKEISLLREKIQHQREKIQHQREKAHTLQQAVERRDQQIQDQRKKASFLQAAVERRDRQIESLQKQCQETEHRLKKLGKWSDRIAHDLGRLLKSNRWRIGCWLSLKRAGSRSKEARRFAQLTASRPGAVRAGESLEPAQSSADEGRLDGINRPSTGAPRSAAPPVSIVIPVYNAHDDLIRCLESVHRHSRPHHRVIMIDDASTDERIWPLLQKWAVQYGNFRAVRNVSNLGYTATVNRGCELAGDGDIILLNSDTIVPSHWIEQLAACAYSQPRVATVTAISNAAGAFSMPRKNENSDLPPGWSIDQMAAFIERNSQRIRPKVPTGNGFCMYITSAARAAVGSFDAEHFPNGYGEENDYCLRASAAGLTHLIDDATYVFHRRSASFGPAKEDILKKSRATLSELHPEYDQLIRDWSQSDALDPAREKLQGQLDLAVAEGVENALPGEQRPCRLFVRHDGIGNASFGSGDFRHEIEGNYRAIVIRVAINTWTLYEYFGDRLIPVRRYVFADLRRIDQPMTPDRLAVIDEICADYRLDLTPARNLLAAGENSLPNVIDGDKSSESGRHKDSSSSRALLREVRTETGRQARPRQIQYRFRITIISSTTNIHGGTKRLLQIAQILHLRGHHVTFVRHFASRELDWFRLDAPLREICFDEHSSLADLEQRLPDADILLTYGNNRAASLLDGLSHRKGAKYLLFMHFGVHDRALDEANATLPGFRKLATTSWISEQLASIGSSARVVGFGIHSEQFFPVDCSRQLRVGTLLHRAEWKGSADVIEAFKIVKKQMPAAQLVAFGQIKDPELGVECEYHFDPSQSQLRHIYSSCSAWVTASLWEGVGMCSLEAMLCKTPLITTDTGGSRDFCHHENCILVEKRSPASIASAILRLLADQEYGTRLAERAYADIQEFGWGKCIERLENVFLSDAQEENPTTIAQRRCELTIGIPVHNQTSYVERCLRSIYENTISDFELILIDDQSDAETQRLLRRAFKTDPERVRYIRNEMRQGFPYNCNRIISNSCGRYICLLNSDTIVTHGWDRHLIDVLKMRPDLAVTGPSTSYGVAKNHDRTAQQLDEVHARRFDMSYEEIQAFAATLRDREAGSVEGTEYLNGFCIMLNSEIIPKIGFFDEKFGLGSREEVEFIDRVRMAGYGCAWVKYAYVHHYGNRSFDPYGASSRQLWENNKRLYFNGKNQQKRVLVTEKRIAFLYTSKLTNSTRKRTFEIARKLQRYLNVETYYLPAVSLDTLCDFDIFVLQRLGGLSEILSLEVVEKTIEWINQYRSEGKIFLYDLDDYVLDAQDGLPRRLIQCCDGVIASTKHLQKLISPINPKCLYLKNGLDYDRFLAAPAAELEVGRFHVVCASLGAVGQAALSQIAREIKSRRPEVEMHFFRDSRYCQNLPHLTLHSMVNLDDLFGYMKAADVVLNFDLPDELYRQQLAQQYGLAQSELNDFINAKSGLKYYNAAAAAKPFVTTPQPACYAEMIHHGVNGFLATSPDDFVDVILRLHGDRTLREKVGQRAFEDILAHFTLDQTVFDYLKAICQVLPDWQSKPASDPDHIVSNWFHEVAET